MRDMVAAAAIARVMHAPIAGAGAVRVSVAASGTTAAKKSAVSQTFNGGSSKGGRRLCEHMKPLAGSASAYLARFSRQWLHQAFFKFFCLCRHHSEPSKPRF